MKTIEISKATGTLAEYAGKLGDEPVILTSHGKPVAALISLENVDLESFALSTTPRFIEIIERSRTRLKNEGGIPIEKMRRRLGL